MLTRAIALAALLTVNNALSIKVSPASFFVGQGFHMKCHVPRDARNRVLDYGVVGYMEHLQRQLDGEAAPITWDFDFTHVPCDAELAYCTVVRADNTFTTVKQSLQVAGCDEGSR